MATDMPELRQINLRLDADLLSAIREYCEEHDITQTEFLVNAAKIQLSIPITENKGDDESLVLQLQSKLERLEKRLERHRIWRIPSAQSPNSSIRSTTRKGSSS